MNGPKPQRLATWILEHCTSDYRRDSLMGDLLEQYRERGACWYWLQALSAVRVRALRSVVTATETEVSAAEFIGDLVWWTALGICGCGQLALCAAVLVRSTSTGMSGLYVAVVSALIAAVFIGGARAAHEIRMKKTRVPLNHLDVWSGRLVG